MPFMRRWLPLPRLLPLLWVCLFAGLVVWTYWPAGVNTRTLQVPASQLMAKFLQDSATEGASAPGLRAARRVNLQTPARLRLGEAGEIRLIFNVDGPEDTTIPNLYVTHSILAEATLELTGMAVSPNFTIGQSLLEGKDIAFTWKVNPEFAGANEGTVWFRLYFVPLDDSSPSEHLISAQRFTISTVSVLGQRLLPTRISGLVGVGAGLLFLVFKALSHRFRHH